LFEHLRQRLSGEPKAKRGTPELVILEPEDASALNLSWNSHFNTAGLRQHLIAYPGMSLRVRNTDEYIIGDKWRRHEGIGQIVESRARLFRAELTDALVEEFRKQGCKAIILGNDEYSDNLRFYQELGFGEIEHIVYYEKPNMLVNYQHEGEELELTLYNKTLAQELLQVDNAAFPWLWWNSSKELEQYGSQEDVTIYLCFRVKDKQPVGYFGFTMYERWAHLDRLAVVPETQGQGVGAFQLKNAIKLMEKMDARRVTLSTQLTNHKSQRLYEGFGFHRVRSLEYSLIGLWLDTNTQG
jgi:ribosomal protein S18 acetylase RimI-like enzyme